MYQGKIQRQVTTIRLESLRGPFWRVGNYWESKHTLLF